MLGDTGQVHNTFGSESGLDVFKRGIKNTLVFFAPRFKILCPFTAGDEDDYFTQGVANRWLVARTGHPSTAKGSSLAGCAATVHKVRAQPDQRLDWHTNDGFDDDFVRNVAVRPTNPQIDVPLAKREVAH